MVKDTYESPLSARYASKEMKYIFSPDKKFRTWRKLWIALAESEKELGLPITQEQIDELKAHADDINYEVAQEREKIVCHDVMSHVYAYGVQCPNAKGIIHLGATSCYVGDNTDIIIMTEGLKLIRNRLITVIRNLSKFADEYKALPTLAFTHFQPAQPTTVGKRATLWLQELLMDLEDVEYQLSKAKLPVQRVQQVHRQVSLNSLTEITKSAKCLIIRLQKKWATRLVSLYQVRHIQESLTHSSSMFLQELLSQPLNSQMISDFFSISKRLKSRLKRIRSVHRLWLTSVTQ